MTERSIGKKRGKNWGKKRGGTFNVGRRYAGANQGRAFPFQVQRHKTKGPPGVRDPISRGNIGSSKRKVPL